MFFWHLSHAHKSVRGTDTTFRRVRGGDEAENAREALDLKDADRLYKVSVKDDVTKKKTFYIVHEPFTNNHIFPLGRGTRCFKAYDCQTEALVLLKDTWRVSKYEPEGYVYRELHEKGVRNIAKFITAGDVGHVCGGVQKFSSAAKDKQPRVHMHYRLVLGTIGTPLTQFSSTWQMVNAVKCALLAHWDAVTKANILHRDVSSGNIVMVGEEGGILIDWELCKRIGQGPATARCDDKTGTWQFISARLLLNKAQEHKVGDDLESFVHDLTWSAIKYARNSLTAEDRTEVLMRFDTSLNKIGGQRKAAMFREDSSAITHIGLERKPLSDVLKRIYSGFGHRYGSTKYEELQLENEQAAKAEVEKLETHNWLYGVLEDALKNITWKAAEDGRVDQEVLKEDRYLTAGQKKRKSMLPEYDEERDEKRAKRH
ncbi:hypothetical protein BDZ97DRAFT_1650439 [Flammula alnicola]|nr:hypothetical protein BDZ97DRAFT_1650439 [Flammula alnicola]